MNIIMCPIGIIHSPFTEKEQTPIQAARSQAIGTVEVYPEFAEGLEDIEHLSHIHLFYVFHQSSGFQLRVKPFLDDREHGVFATRHPCRPNPLGISTVRLLSCRENTLTVEGVDVLDGTPLLDIKPYIPDFDARQDVRIGWYGTRSQE